MVRRLLYRWRYYVTIAQLFHLIDIKLLNVVKIKTDNIWLIWSKTQTLIDTKLNLREKKNEDYI